MLDFFTGYRTKILAAITLLGAFLMDMGWITAANWDAIIKYIIPLIALAIHAAIKNAAEKVEVKIETVAAKVETVERKVENVAPVVAAKVAVQVKEDIKAVVADNTPSFSHRPGASHIVQP